MSSAAPTAAMMEMYRLVLEFELLMTGPATSICSVSMQLESLVLSARTISAPDRKTTVLFSPNSTLDTDTDMFRSTV